MSAYETKEESDGWSIIDTETRQVAIAYGYPMQRLLPEIAQQLVEVFNRLHAESGYRPTLAAHGIFDETPLH